MSEKNDEYRYVLWIRHCKACHNENAFFSEQPLCNENGINQAYEFGKQFSKINEMIDVKGPVIFDCLVKKEENCFPMIPSGKPHNEMILGPDDEDGITEEGKVLV